MRRVHIPHAFRALLNGELAPGMTLVVRTDSLRTGATGRSLTGLKAIPDVDEFPASLLRRKQPIEDGAHQLARPLDGDLGSKQALAHGHAMGEA